MPTAMPEAPLSSRFGSRAGSISGSSRVPSKFGRPVDRAMLELLEQQVGVARQARFGVAHGRERLGIVGGTPVALAVDDRIAEREVLRHVHHGLVAGRIAVRMELADHIADRARRFLVLGGGRQAQLAHRVDDAALHRLEPVAERRQRAIEDHVHRIVEVGLLGERAERALFHALEVQLRSAISPPPRPGCRCARATRAGRRRASWPAACP